MKGGDFKIPAFYPKKKKVVRKKRTSVNIGKRTNTRGKGSLTRTRTRTRRTYRDDTAVGDLALFRTTGGRKSAKNLRGAWKLINSQIQKNMYFIDSVNRFQTPGPQGICGSLSIGSSWSGNSFGNGTFTMPLHLWSITAAPNVMNGTVVKPNAQYGLQRTSASGTMTFTTGTPYAVGNVGGTTTAPNAYPGQTDQLKAVSIKMVLYGTLGRPVKYRLDLVQIMEPYLHPDVIFNSATQVQQQNIIAFYDELTREFTYSPATFSNSNAVKGKIKYLKSWTHLIQPSSTAERQAGEINSTNQEITQMVPHSHVVNIYERINRHQKYNWFDTTTTAESTGQFGGYGGSDQPPSDAGDNLTDVTWRARIYLMVRALAPMPTMNNTVDQVLTPSYDISLRTYHVSLG